MDSRGIEKLIEDMSLEEKARQLTQINALYVKKDIEAEVTGVSAGMRLDGEDIAGIGSVLNFGDAADAAYVRQRHLKSSPRKIPLLMMQDVIHGYRTIFPVPLALGCTFDTALVEECAAVAAVEAKYNGVDVTFSPMVDLARDARWGRVVETTGEDPYLNGEMGAAFIRGYRRGGVEACVKHFAAYGAPEAGREYNTVDISEHALKEYYLRAYCRCLEEKPACVMTSFNVLNGVPVNGHTDLLVGLLRGELGYNGVVISDYGAVREMIVHGYAATEEDCARIAAGNRIDIEMMSSTYLEHLPALVRQGKISMQTVDGMVRRVLDLKLRLGLFDDPLHGTDEKKAREVCLCGEHRALARRAAERACVLLKNNGVLPLKTTASVSLIGPFARTKQILGAWACAGRAEEAVSVAEGVERLLGREVPVAEGCSAELLSRDESGFAAAVRAAAGSEVIVLCIGEPSRCAGEGASRADIALPRVQVKLLRALKETGKPVVAVVFGGRPQALTDVDGLADAVLYAWQPGTEGGNAIAALLFGAAAPSGRLAMSFPRSVGQCPIYYNALNTGRPKGEDRLDNCTYNSSYRDELNAPLYPFGYGLGYTTFSYGGLTLSSPVLRRGGTVVASVRVANTGSRGGEETVQLYIRDRFASAVRPVKELKGFTKIYLEAGEEKVVRFTVTEETLKFFTADGTYAAEAGTFDIMAGGDSAHVLSAPLVLED